MRRNKPLLRVVIPSLAWIVLVSSKISSAQVTEVDTTRDAPDRSKTTRVWNAKNSGDVLALKGHTNGIVSAAFGPRGDQVVTGSGDCTARVWDAATGARLLTIAGTGFNGCYATVSQDGSRIVTSNHWIVKTWDAKTGKELLDFTPMLGLKQYWPIPFEAAISPDAKRVITCSPVFNLKLRDATTGEDLVTLKGHTYWPNSSAFSPDGARVVTGCHADDAARVWDSKTGEELFALKGHGRGVWSVGFAPDGRQVATGGANGTVHVWDMNTGNELLTFAGHEKVITAVSFSPDNSLILTGSQDRTARLWDAKSGAEHLVLKGHSDIVNAAAFSSDGNRIVTASWDKTALIWDFRQFRNKSREVAPPPQPK